MTMAVRAVNKMAPICTHHNTHTHTQTYYEDKQCEIATTVAIALRDLNLRISDHALQHNPPYSLADVLRI
jgi:hypothetical protein